MHLQRCVWFQPGLHTDPPEPALKLRQLWKCREVPQGNEIRIDLHWALAGYFFLWKEASRLRWFRVLLQKKMHWDHSSLLERLMDLWVKSKSGRLKVRWQSLCSFIAISCTLKLQEYVKAVLQLHCFPRLTQRLCASGVTVNILHNVRISLPKALPQCWM